MAEAEARRYTGLDPSPEAVALARAKRPDWDFIHGTISAVEGRLFDLVLCGCVLIHIPTRDAYLDLVRRLVDACRDTLVIEAYNRPPSLASEITYFHEPLAETLRRDPRIGAVRTIGLYRDIDVVLAQRVEAVAANAWHIPPELLAKGLQLVPDPALLRQIVDFAKDRLGFFPKTSIRMREYPWAVAEAGNVRGRRLLDLGAGVNPLPLWFAAHGATVVTIDSHPCRRTPADRSSWNEWGFLDYAAPGRQCGVGPRGLRAPGRQRHVDPRRRARRRNPGTVRPHLLDQRIGAYPVAAAASDPGPDRPAARPCRPVAINPRSSSRNPAALELVGRASCGRPWRTRRFGPGTCRAQGRRVPGRSLRGKPRHAPEPDRLGAGGGPRCESSKAPVRLVYEQGA